jgi:hypothetical protein
VAGLLQVVFENLPDVRFVLYYEYACHAGLPPYLPHWRSACAWAQVDQTILRLVTQSSHNCNATDAQSWLTWRHDMSDREASPQERGLSDRTPCEGALQP